MKGYLGTFSVGYWGIPWRQVYCICRSIHLFSREVSFFVIFFLWEQNSEYSMRSATCLIHVSSSHSPEKRLNKENILITWENHILGTSQTEVPKLLTIVHGF